MTDQDSPRPTPRLIPGGISVDERGSLAYVNGFDFAGVRRFYLVGNHREGFVRAWHAHRREAKYVTVTRGVALIGAVAIDDWESPARDVFVHRHVLAASAPQLLYVPPGYANGFMSLTADATLLFFSTASLDESRTDDVRFDSRYWDIWHVAER